MNDCLMIRVPPSTGSNFEWVGGDWGPGSAEGAFYKARVWSADLRNVIYWALKSEATLDMLQKHEGAIAEAYDKIKRGER